ncbi:MAG: autotransporter outer membrane beta-barrel domain-containing protein, partial [Alphaproteobacteria bacterium]
TTNGVSVSGQVSASSANAPSIGLHLASGAIVPEIFVNQGVVSAGLTTKAGIPVEAHGIQIDSGATVGTLNNSGSIRAGVNGPAGGATAVLDSSGTLAVVNNSNTIFANLKSTDSSVAAVGEAIALDLRANTTGVTFIQDLRAFDAAPPTLSGDILLSSGNHNDRLTINAGITEGLISFGGGADTITVDGDSTVRGGIDKGAGTLNVTLTNGTLDLDRHGIANVSNLAVGSSSVLIFSADPANANPALRTTGINVAGTASFDAGAELKLKLLGKLLADQSFTILSAGNLINGGLDTTLAEQVPALFTGDVVVRGNQITLDMRRRSASELQLTGARAQEFESFYKAFDADPGVTTQILAKTTDADFKKLYEQFLPDYSGGPFRTLSNTVREGLAAQAEAPTDRQAGQPRSWLQEIGLTVKQETVDEVPYQTGGFGIIGGYERPTRDGGYLGFSGGYMSSEIRNKIRFLGSHLAASAVTGGLYWRQPEGNLVLDADVTGGFAWFDSVRRIVDATPTGTQLLVRQAEGSWNGYMGAARVGAAYNLDLGRWYVRPSANINAVALSESAYTEHGGGAAVDLAVESRNNYEASAELGMIVGGSFGRSYRWGPEFEIGYRSILASGDGNTTAAFASVAGTGFT